jgi:eukaryotic-like serine/threonine-protein kinase
VRALDDGRLTAYPGSEGAQYPFWSPDGRWIAFFSRVDGTLKRVPVQGRPPLRICRALNGKWRQLEPRRRHRVRARPPGTALYRVPAEGGTPEQVTELGEPYNRHRHPRFLPDGRHFLFLARSSRKAPRARYTARLARRGSAAPGDPLAGAGRARVGTSPLRARFGSHAQPFDPASATLSGEARPIADGVLEMTEAAYTAFSASTTGRLVLHSGFAGAGLAI